MYEELVKRLRELHPEEFSNAWDFAFACQQAMCEAADAIEELSKELEKYKLAYHEQLQYTREEYLKRKAHDNFLWTGV